jgi:hypothetical protein
LGKIDHNIVFFLKPAIVFAENCRKSQEIVTIAYTPVRGVTDQKSQQSSKSYFWPQIFVRAKNFM